MARRIFSSLHYKPGNGRVANVRNMGVIEGNRSSTDNDWKTIMWSLDYAIKRWIDDQMTGTSCYSYYQWRKQSDRKWINHESMEAWNRGKGVP